MNCQRCSARQQADALITIARPEVDGRGVRPLMMTPTRSPGSGT
jgi:hypothetical protein